MIIRLLVPLFFLSSTTLTCLYRIRYTMHPNSFLFLLPTFYFYFPTFYSFYFSYLTYGLWAYFLAHICGEVECNCGEAKWNLPLLLQIFRFWLILIPNVDLADCKCPPTFAPPRTPGSCARLRSPLSRDCLHLLTCSLSC